MSSKYQNESLELPILSPSMMSQRGKRKSSSIDNITPSTSVSQDLDSADQNNDYPNEKKMKPSSSSRDEMESKSPSDIRLYMENTFDVRRSFITIEAPTIAMIKETYPCLFIDKELLVEFQRVTDLDIDHTIQEYCVKYASGIIDLSRNYPGSSGILQQASEVKEENVALRQYWDMVTALCLLPMLMRENLTEMVYEIGSMEEPDPKGRIVPMLLSKGPIFKSDEFFLVAEEQIVQEFEEFTIAFAALFSAYWVFNMQYPRTLTNTYNFIQKGILHIRDSYPIPPVSKQLVQRLQKWGRVTDGKAKRR
ncbi:Hypothetical predicted protein [Octopus vulgaris]|uniref:Uncharacterized protein n=2 Tax=Octopus TaxID=6643 RepID=A0AA36AUA4_OCTVU|nr:uncharacterized protein LOC115212038 [Octopus sinensis]XP_029636701.1 uncharacterized protein LOC115212038 [Octopus sinensis]XP_036359304.1 uncharacterized protein LOC115212038 [Octopus sinensis]CAI9722431.1 Hypothetical predicted protein [Octopus vulgaris]